MSQNQHTSHGPIFVVPGKGAASLGLADVYRVVNILNMNCITIDKPQMNKQINTQEKKQNVAHTIQELIQLSKHSLKITLY